MVFHIFCSISCSFHSSRFSFSIAHIDCNITYNHVRDWLQNGTFYGLLASSTSMPKWLLHIVRFYSIRTALSIRIAAVSFRTLGNSISTDFRTFFSDALLLGVQRQPIFIKKILVLFSILNFEFYDFIWTNVDFPHIPTFDKSSEIHILHQFHVCNSHIDT